MFEGAFCLILYLGVIVPVMSLIHYAIGKWMYELAGRVRRALKASASAESTRGGPGEGATN